MPDMQNQETFIEKFYGYWLIIAIITGVAVGVLIRGFGLSGELAFYTLPISAPAIVLSVTIAQFRAKRGEEKAPITEHIIPAIITLHSFLLFFTS